MNLTDYSCAEFSRLLASDAPTPGGGSSAAMTGAFGVSLLTMVARLSLGREKYAEYEAANKEILEISDHLTREFLIAADADAEAYEKVSAAYKSPKNTEEQKGIRKSAIEEALKHAADIPLGVMELTLRALNIAKSALGRTNANAASDLGTAALCLRTALNGAWLNVLINLGGIKDGAFTAERESRGQAIIDEALPIADEIYNTIIHGIKGE